MKIREIKSLIYVWIIFAMGCLGACVPHSETCVVDFKPDTLSLLRNPCMGWGVYDDANDEVQQAETYWSKQGSPAEKYASFFYIRWRWSEMEPEEGRYAWLYDENYKALIKGALDRGLKLCFRIYNHSQDNWAQSTPEYVRKAGAKGYMAKGIDGRPLWTPYPDDPVFLAKLEKFVQAFAREYDNPAYVDFVDAYNIGFWGECHNIRLLKPGQKELEAVLDKISTIYSSNFRKVMLVLPFGSEVGFEAEHRIAIGPKGYSMRRDGLGSMWFTEKEQEITQRMYGKTLLIGESCWWSSCSDSVRPYASDQKYKLENWRDVYELTCKQALQGHFNTLDLRELPETEGWTTRAPDLVQRFITKGGYRIYPMRISYQGTIAAGDSLTIAHQWVNLGTGYLPNNVKNWNHKYKPAFVLIDSAGNEVYTCVDTQAEPADWLYEMPKSYELKVAVPSLVPGNYRLAVAIVDTTNKNTPAIRLAIAHAERWKDWYVIGELKVE